MTLLEMKKKVLGLIEELNPDSAYLTADPDIAAKLADVINQIQYELARHKKIPMFAEIPVRAGQVLTFTDIAQECGYEIYQIKLVSGVSCQSRAGGTAYRILSTGTALVDCFVYPEQITEKTKDNYEFELSPDVLEIMPYGVAADLLKSDVSAQYGTVYATRYESMLQRLDPRYAVSAVYIEGGLEL